MVNCHQSSVEWSLNVRGNKVFIEYPAAIYHRLVTLGHYSSLPPDLSRSAEFLFSRLSGHDDRGLGVVLYRLISSSPVQAFIRRCTKNLVFPDKKIFFRLKSVEIRGTGIGIGANVRKPEDITNLQQR